MSLCRSRSAPSVDQENGLCWVAWIHHQGEKQLLSASYGRDENEAKKRLISAAQKRLENEARYCSQPGQVLNAKIESSEVADFVSSMGCKPNEVLSQVKWLFRKY